MPSSHLSAILEQAKAMSEEREPNTEAWREALRRQADAEAHDRSLMVERLAWTPEQRLKANTAFLRFYWGVRPERSPDPRLILDCQPGPGADHPARSFFASRT